MNPNGKHFDSPYSAGRREWFCIDTGEHTGEYNMKFDLGLVEEFKITGIPVLRFFKWKPYCISLGRNQDETDIDAAGAHRDGIEIVRRPTGGKAVLHAEELTYSVVMETAGLSVRDSYNRISSALVAGLRKLVPELELSQSSADFQKLFRDPAAIPCFSTSAVYEVEYMARKVVGSAQHRFGEVLLQHGSILTGSFHKKLIDYLKVDEDVREKTRADLDSHTASLGDILGRIPSLDEVSGAVKYGFESAFGADFANITGRDDRYKLHQAGRVRSAKPDA